MRRAHAAAVVAIVVALAVGGGYARGAGAVSKGSGELRGGMLHVGIDTAVPGHPSAPVDAQSSSLRRLVHYISTALAPGRPGDLANLCNANPRAGNDTGQLVFGWLYKIVGYSDGGLVVSSTQECVPFPNDDDHTGPPPPPVLPVAPTVGDVWRAVGLPRPVVGVNPVTRGVTGLATRLWSGGVQTVQVALTIGAYRINGLARVIEYRFATDDGYLGAAISPGDESNPAASHEFATKGAHSLSIASVWRANVTMVGPNGAAPVPIDIDIAVLTATVAYPVVEVRSRLVA